MKNNNTILMPMLALIMVTSALTGCTSDDDGTDWGNPTQIAFSGFGEDSTKELVYVNFTLGDKKDFVTKAN